MKRSYILILLVFILLGVMLNILLTKAYTIAPFRYSTRIEEARKEKTLISKYLVYDTKGKQLSNAWLEYARKYNIFNNKKIIKNTTLLRIKSVKEFEENNDVYWEAFFKNKKLTAFEEKGIISVVEVDNSMDSIKIKPNKDETFYVVKDYRESGYVEIVPNEKLE